jgi:C4-dicarboxylate-binding protein DctP
VNKKFWDGIPADIRKTLEGAMKDASDYNNEVSQKDNDDAMAAMKASGKINFRELTPQERKAWTAKLMPVHKEMESRVGADLIRDIHQATGTK